MSFYCSRQISLLQRLTTGTLPQTFSPFARTARFATPAPTGGQVCRLGIILSNRRSFASSSVKMGVHNVTSKEEFDSAISQHKVVVLDAFATWCGPCKVIAPSVVEFSNTYTNAHFIKVDVDDVPEVAQELGIRAMPTFLVFEDGKKVKEVVGADKSGLQKAIEAHHVEEKDEEAVKEVVGEDTAGSPKINGADHVEEKKDQAIVASSEL